MSTTPILQTPSKDYPETIDNWAVLQELKILQEKLQEKEVADYVTPVDNREILQKLELEKDELTSIITSIGFGSILTGLTTFSIALLGLLLAWKPMVRLEKVARLIKLITAILEEFESQQVETLPLQKVPGREQPIDLMIRFPGKEFLLLAIRSFGEATIIYNESRGMLYYKRERKGLNKLKPDPLTDLSEQAYWLKKNRRDFFGSSKGVRKPMAKVLVIWGQTKLATHQEHLYTTLGGQKFLFIPREGGACYVIHQTQVIEFIRAYLAHRQSQEQAA
ncbi:hypothetical protein [Trichocoleus sp. FACHB-262]|uniref:hypothetical protein n=1 Tax=Trichocoleus sp. FACHB-262 TaxID=2692869 RepID=UPI00168818AB|nr:hypothetical protein [Trichocoleus sp. FACHB-262]MBD2123268.1 hypothetical protein [Trichocoleus sp. FACHB-262]